MKKITFLTVLLISAMSFGQNGAAETISTTPNPNVTNRVTDNNTVISNSGEMGRSNSSYNGVVYHNPESNRNMMPVLAYESGPYFNVAGTPDVSLLEDTTLLMGTYGAGVQISAGNRIAEDIILADDYDVTSMEFFAYQSFTPTAPPTIDAINVQVWDGDPSLPGSSIVYGDATTNVLTSVVWSGAYRQLESNPNTDRAIHRITVDTPGLSLAAGTYWVDWQIGGTAASGPWQPPVAILGQTTTGNAMQSIAGVWAPLEDGGTFTAQGAPVRVMGDCTSCAGGGVSIFTSLVDLEASCGSTAGFTMENFEGVNITPGSFNGCGLVVDSTGSSPCYDPGEIEEGFSMTSSTADVFIAGPGALQPEVLAGANLFSDFTILNFTGPDDVFSVAFDLFNNVNADNEIRVFDTGGILLDTFTVTNPIGTQNFHGFISTVPIGRMEIDSPANGNDLIANLMFGVCAASNDECSNAIAMTCGDIETGDTTTNTDTGGANDSLDAWYSFTGTGTGEIVTFSLCDGTATHDTLLTVFDSCGGAQVAQNDDACGLQSEVSFFSDGTTTYFVAVEGFDNTEAGAFAIEVSCNPVAANDLCDDAVAITCGDVVAGSTTFATIDDSVASTCDGVDITAAGVWYTYTETIPGFIQDISLSTCDDADFDTKISVYTGDCGTLTCVAGNDDDPACAGFTSTVDFQSDGISTYYILVHGFGTQTGDFNLTMTCSPLAPPNDMIVNSIDVDEAGLPYTDPAVNMPGATTEAGGTPADCDNAGVLGVWYNFVAELNGTATASVTTPAAYTSVTFYTAPDEEAVETDLVLVDYFDNQCLPGTDASILVTAGQAYYVYVANHSGVTDIVIDGDFYLGVGDTNIEGFTYYPNPADDQLNLRSGNGAIESAIIYNILGQEVLSQKVGSNNAQLNVAGLTVGTYILKVVVDGQLGIYKIVKQ